MIFSSFHGAWIVSLIALLGATLGCVGPAAGGHETQGPSFGPGGADFKKVSTVLERRCGTLDCHGSTFRPLRIYSQLGLRKPLLKGEDGAPADYDNYYSGGGVETTPAELLDNYNSVVGLEPELIDEVARGLSKDQVVQEQGLPCPFYPTNFDQRNFMTPECLTLIRKPRLQEKHKGGQIWIGNNKEGDGCIAGWVKNSLLGNPNDPNARTAYLNDCDAELRLNR
jgi:hypothetical protein